MSLTYSKTERGFSLIQFKDRYGSACSIQKSSLATEDAVWFGCDDADPKILASDARAHGMSTDAPAGWVPYRIHDEVVLTTRMHLTRGQVQELLPTLKHFVETGELRGGIGEYLTVRQKLEECLAALRGVVRVADRATVEFDAARAAIARCEGER